MSSPLSVHDVVQKFRDLASGPGGGVLPVFLHGHNLPEGFDGRLGVVAGKEGSTSEAVQIMNELRKLEDTAEGRGNLVWAYKRFRNEEGW